MVKSELDAESIDHKTVKADGNGQLMLDLGECVTPTPTSAIEQYLERKNALETLQELAYALGEYRATVDFRRRLGLLDNLGSKPANADLASGLSFLSSGEAGRTMWTFGIRCSARGDSESLSLLDRDVKRTASSFARSVQSRYGFGSAAKGSHKMMLSKVAA